jgi:hypothetical protein
MSKLVVILGAGASADFGVPTLGHLFKDTQAKIYLRNNSWLATHLNEIFWKPRGHDLNTSEKSLTVEEMLTILRDWELEKAVPARLNNEELARFRKSIYVLIYKALFEGKSTKKEHLNTLIDFARKQFEQTTWASFNWDCIFESSFWYSSGPWGPGNRTNPNLAINLNGWRNGSLKHVYLKLHGSINWWFNDGKLNYFPFSNDGALQSQWETYSKDDAPTTHPVILEPSYYKYSDSLYKQLEPQWNVFLKNLVAADYILVIGYSLPNADSQARCKMLTAFQANPNSLWGVIDPNPETLDRYRRLFGQTRLQVFTGGLVGFNNKFEENFQLLFPTFSPKSS